MCLLLPLLLAASESGKQHTHIYMVMANIQSRFNIYMANAGARALTLRPPPCGSEQDMMSDTALGVWLDRFDLHASQVLYIIVGSQYSTVCTLY